jgi:hypothetical protein
MAKAADEHTTYWSVDAADEYLRRNVGLQDDLAIFELNEKLTQGRLPMHWRRADNAGEGIVPAMSWQSGPLAVTRDRNQNAVDWATGKLATKNDGRAFVQAFAAEDSGCTYELTVPERIVRVLWPVSKVSTETIASVKSPARRRSGPVLKHDWHAINGEIARRCHDKSRRISVPENESKLAADVLQWCEDMGRPQPADSAMRDAVKAICAALRQKI